MKHVDGNLFDSKEQYICHQVNCVTNKAAHLAKSVFERYPHADVYTNRKGRDKLGSILVRENVIALVGQLYPGKSKYPNDTYEIRERAFETCISKLFKLDDLESLAFPWGIGCGAAGGNWDNYYKIIDKYSKEHPSVDVTIYKLK
jgi:hypothetical protein